MNKITLLALSLGVSGFANAGETWVTLNAVSYHVNAVGARAAPSDYPDKKYNERNYGLGIEHQLDANGLPVILSVGAFRNSSYKTSVYGFAGLMPISFNVLDTNVRIGAVVGLINGYPRMNDGGFTPAVMGIVNVGFTNILVIPPTSTTPTTIGLQFKFK